MGATSRRKPADGKFPAIRAKEIQRVVRDRYGLVLPDDDAGRDDLRVLLRHLAHLHRGERRMANYLELAAPWLRDTELTDFLQEAAQTRPPRLSADTIARMLNVTMAERTRLGLTTIGAVDCDREERERRRRHRAKERQRKRRRKRGRKSRADYLARSLSRSKPWEAEGISRRTWYRRRTST